jgi:hypothetical protein
MTADSMNCPECGFPETGRFCRRCGKLLHTDALVLCPRCHQAVPEDRYCNACGQILTRTALRLVTLESLGEAFWVPGDEEPEAAALPEWLSDFPDAAASPAEPGAETVRAPDEEIGLLQPDHGPGASTQPFVLVALALMVALVAGVLGLLIWLLVSGLIA